MPPQTRDVARTQTADPVQRLTEIQEKYGPQAMAALPEIARAVKLAEGILATREVVASMLPMIRGLIGSQLGFRTDMDSKGGYRDDNVIVECCTEAFLRGFSWVGNEFNIIAGRFYGTKEGYSRKVCEFPNLTDLLIAPGVPKMFNGGAVVKMTATYNLNGAAKRQERDIPVRVNGGMGADAIIGKAKRKMLASIYERLTGSRMSDADDEVEVVAEVPTTQTLKDKMLANKAASEPAPLAEGEIPNEPDADDPPAGQPLFQSGANPMDSVK